MYQFGIERPALEIEPLRPIRVSMRSDSDLCNVAAVCGEFKGGGHVRAAGCTLELPLEEATRIMREALTEALA